MFKFAIVGTGYIGLSHIAAINSLPNAEVAAVISTNPAKGQKAADEAGCKCYPTLESAAADTAFDAVDVCLPTFLHEEYAVKAANMGKHVLCEKPVTFTLESFDRMAGACKENGVRLMVAQVARWWPEFMVIKDYVDNGSLGDIHMVYENRLAQHPNWSTWHRDPAKSGGGLYDMNVHDIDYLYTVFGMPKSVYATGWKSPSGCWNHVSANLTWANGAKAVCETSLEMTGEFPFSIGVRIVGDKGTIAYSMTAGHNIKDGDMGSDLMWYPADGAAQPLHAEPIDMFAAEIAEFVGAVTENRPAAVTVEQSRQVLEIVVGIKRSLEEGIIVNF